MATRAGSCRALTMHDKEPDTGSGAPARTPSARWFALAIDSPDYLYCFRRELKAGLLRALCRQLGIEPDDLRRG